MNKDRKKKDKSIYSEMNRVVVRILILMLLTCLTLVIMGHTTFSELDSLLVHQQIYDSFESLLESTQEELINQFHVGSDENSKMQENKGKLKSIVEQIQLFSERTNG